MREATLSRKGTPLAKRTPCPPTELTQEELERLLRAFTQGKTEILEDDALTLVKWAQLLATA